MQNEPTNLLTSLNNWLKRSITIKLGSIGFLVLILLIPSSWIQDLMHERQQRASSVINEVADKWSGSQTLSGPMLVVPYRDYEKVYNGKDIVEVKEVIKKAFFLPENLIINGAIKPQILHRGIFDVAVYESALAINAQFNFPDVKSLGINNENILWGETYLALAITDLRGINDNPLWKYGEQILLAEPTNNLGVAFREMKNSADEYEVNNGLPYELTATGIIAKLKWASEADFNKNTSLEITIKGSNTLSFSPTGKTTAVTLSGPWSNPSFDGAFLPDERDVSEQGFSASWKVLHFNRPFAQQWKDNEQSLSGSEFGVRLLIPVDQYQKSIRSSKYSVLLILFTFVALFLIEIIQKIRIHPFQYILIGASLIIYYILLLSLSEHIGYNFSYWMATLATVTLVTAYSTSFLNNKKVVGLFSFLLVMFYGFIFVIILQQDYSLLFGSIGLFILVGMLMYFSRKVNWYGDESA